MPETRTLSPWMAPCTLSLESLISFTIALAFSDSMPWAKVSSCCTVLPLCSTGPYLTPRRLMPRLASFSTRTSRAASRRCSVELRIWIPFSFSFFSTWVSVPLKS